jgi:hypothetical protein
MSSSPGATVPVCELLAEVASKNSSLKLLSALSGGKG